MKRTFALLILALITLGSCKKDNFFDKFVPEVLYYEKNEVENADFVATTLPAGVSEWTVKARVSAPMKLEEIKLLKSAGGKNEELLETYNDFQLSPNVYNLEHPLQGITEETTIKIVATDADNKSTTRTFIIKLTP